ncbi:CyP450 monooxygenase [Fomitiporia mediterranea MF3/22]|uniref:CyP450 monooxygenase n=1 Tax=Fomitiporia mediterranea (strain MF3/22) TaxID=694068 RepID=UPI0004408C45|nr:CyP450 monooxygenase [Fomitiporia mediterranea MF3/22]EJD02108.1 CyP450 monooxygenase [Fomitiporia mediterranea MF3/22]
MPLNQPWETFTQWGKDYGEVVHVHVFNQSIIIVNTAKAANDLFEKRSSIYSDRPRLPLLGELTGFDWVFALMVYGDLWKKYRKLFISKFGPGTVQMFNPAQDYASTKLLELLLDRPEEFEDHVRLHIVQQILMSVYGFAPDSRNDDFVVLAERALNAISDLARPGAFLVDAFPFLKKIPSWVPGQFYHKMAEQLKSDVQGMRDVPIVETKDMMANGTLPVPCYVSELLEKQEREKNEKFDPELENIIRDTGTIAYGAGSDTCVAALNAFFLAMALNPEVQRKAQAEIDSVVGSARLPTQTDRKDLPYTTAVMKELLRWHVIAPQSLPHMLKEDDVYEGYYLPKGAIVLGNTWGILHDPEVYPEPMEFKPERYINAAGQLECSSNDPSKFAFGYGRRYCPAFYYTEDALHLALARILATFDIGLAKDKNGAVIPSVHLPTSGIISHPTSFKCSIAPRSQEAVALIRQASVNIKHSFKS